MLLEITKSLKQKKAELHPVGNISISMQMLPNLHYILEKSRRGIKYDPIRMGILALLDDIQV